MLPRGSQGTQVKHFKSHIKIFSRGKFHKTFLSNFLKFRPEIQQHSFKVEGQYSVLVYCIYCNARKKCEYFNSANCERCFPLALFWCTLIRGYRTCAYA